MLKITEKQTHVVSEYLQANSLENTKQGEYLWAAIKQIF